MYKTFIISYVPFMSEDDARKFAAFVQSNVTTHQFYFPFFGTILIKSSFDLNLIVRSYHDYLGGGLFFVAEIDPQKTGGALDPRMWEWVNSSNPTVPSLQLGSN